MLFIENTQTHLMGIGGLVVAEGTAPRSILIRPGINRIERDVWELLKKNPIIQKKIEYGFLKVALEGEIAERIAQSESLTELHHKQAVKMVEGCFDRATLIAWRNTENRPVVIKAIENQIALFETKKQEITEKESEFL